MADSSLSQISLSFFYLSSFTIQTIDYLMILQMLLSERIISTNNLKLYVLLSWGGFMVSSIDDCFDPSDLSTIDLVENEVQDPFE